ncbi:HEAT repeat domain-containing protein [Actinomadura viridis]|uniref:HEAT repeat domain-containing protein n=1 Tax=Actinomadura viridis TaxID=58110 RepID=UPI0036A26F4A
MTAADDTFLRAGRPGEPRLDAIGLVRLAERLGARDGGEEIGEGAGGEARYAEALPSTLDGSPEATLALARLYLRLGPYLRDRPWPRWREAGLPVPVRIAWLRAEIAARPETLRHEPAGEPLYQAVHGLAAIDADAPGELLRALSERPEPALRAEALRIAREAVRAALLAPARARAVIVRLLDPGAEPCAATADLVTAALRELAEPWAALDPLPRDRLHRLLAAPPTGAVAEAALGAAARHGHRDLLREVAGDPGRPPALRRRALELLGDLATRDDVADLAGLAATDPLLLAGPAVRCLAGMHRRGHFPSGADVPAVVGLALADHAVPAGDLATVLFTARHETLRALAAAPPDDPSWPRRLELLVALAAQGTGGLPAGAAATAPLAAAADPVPFLEAIRALRHTEAEESVLAALPRAPAAALRTLEAVGGHRTVTALREGLGLDGTGGTVVAHLRPVRHRALELLWRLTEDAAERRRLLDRLDPRDLPPRVAADLGGPDARELELLRAGLDPGDPAGALCALARNGDAGTVPVIAYLLLRVASDLASAAAPATAPEPARHRGRRGAPPVPPGEPEVPDEVITAIRGLGARLHRRGRIRPRCLLDAAGPEEAGDALVASLALDLLERPGTAPAEHAILLRTLLRLRPGPLRARLHPLLRHRDRHVRKHVIALLAREAGGSGTRALSAGLIALTRAPDAQTVRQALLALGGARAGWAAAAIADCLDHPSMNVKKTAAAALATAGAPQAVPALLAWLGRHENPGLRDALDGALRAILGDGHAATLVAAADLAGDERTRTLLLRPLVQRSLPDPPGRALPARSIGALARQGSPAGATLLRLAADERGPARRPAPDADLESLAEHGWNAAAARRLTGRHERDPEPIAAARPERLRPLLAHWLELAGAEDDPGPVLRLTLRVCPAPWSGEEIGLFARSAGMLVTALPLIGDAYRDRLLAVLEESAGRWDPGEALEIAARIRASPPGAAGSRAELALLRRCGAVLTRGDLERALAVAGSGPDPWLGREAVLREAFGLPGACGSPTGDTTDAAAVDDPDDAPDDAARDAVRAWREELEEAVRSPEALRRFRATGAAPAGAGVGSRERLEALAAAFPSAGEGVRGLLLDWMLEAQPLGAPAWTLAEEAARPLPPEREPRPGDLDQPRSADQRERLLAMLDGPDRDRRDHAARVLAGWPEPEIRRAVLRAFLQGRADVPRIHGLAPELPAVVEDLPALELEEDPVRERAVRAAAHLDAARLARLVPWLLGWWEHGGPATRAEAWQALRRADADLVAQALTGRLDEGAWGMLDVLTGRPLLRTPALIRARDRLRAEGRDGMADAIVLVDGPLRPPGAVGEDAAAALAALRTRRPVPADGAERPLRAELFALARTGAPGQVRRALTVLAERHDEVRARGGRDPELEELVTACAGHPEARVRLHAHRISRRVLERADHLELTARLLADPRPDIVRTAVRTVTHAAWRPAIPALVGLLAHARPEVRGSAADGLVRFGEPAVPALRHAAGRARPDRRPRYTAVLGRIAAAAPPE